MYIESEAHWEEEEEVVDPVAVATAMVFAVEMEKGLSLARTGLMLVSAVLGVAVEARLLVIAVRNHSAQGLAEVVVQEVVHSVIGMVVVVVVMVAVTQV